MQSLLYTVGLGVEAIPLSAGLNWVLKDGLGQFGGMIFASKVNINFDRQPKRWRFFSSLCLEGANWLEALTPSMPILFIPLASVANIGKNISFLSASASRAALHKAASLKNNLADVTVKSGSQTIAGSMIGFLFLYFFPSLTSWYAGTGIAVAITFFLSTSDMTLAMESSNVQLWQALLPCLALSSTLHLWSMHKSLSFPVLTELTPEVRNASVCLSCSFLPFSTSPSSSPLHHLPPTHPPPSPGLSVFERSSPLSLPPTKHPAL